MKSIIDFILNNIAFDIVLVLLLVAIVFIIILFIQKNNYLNDLQESNKANSNAWRIITESNVKIDENEKVITEQAKTIQNIKNEYDKYKDQKEKEVAVAEEQANRFNEFITTTKAEYEEKIDSLTKQLEDNLNRISVLESSDKELFNPEIHIRKITKDTRIEDLTQLELKGFSKSEIVNLAKNSGVNYLTMKMTKEEMIKYCVRLHNMKLARELKDAEEAKALEEKRKLRNQKAKERREKKKAESVQSVLLEEKHD